MTLLLQFWRGQLSLGRSFWLGWAIPVIGGNFLLSFCTWWLISHVGLVAYFATVALMSIYTLVAVVPIWRSASVYAGHKLFKYGARTFAALTTLLPIAGLVAIVASLIAIKSGNDPTSDPSRITEKTAIPSQTHPTAGFWKDDCTHNFGLAIAPAEGTLYSVSFCGPGGCFKPGSYRPNTPIVGDSNYQVVDTNTLRVLGNDGWSTYARAPSREGSTCSPP